MNVGKNNQDSSLARRTRRTLLVLLAAMTASYWVGRELGLGNDELVGYLLASLVLVATAGLVGLIVFGVLRLLRR